MTLEGRVLLKDFAGIGEVRRFGGEDVTIVPGKEEVHITIGTGVTAEIFGRDRNGDRSIYWLYDYRKRETDTILHDAGALIITPRERRIRVPTHDYLEGQRFKVEGLGEWQWNRGSGKKSRKKARKERMSL